MWEMNLQTSVSNAWRRIINIEVERPKLIGELVLDSIRDLIIKKELPPGARLSEGRLANMLNVSKTPVREALLQLRTIGLVRLEDGVLCVASPSPDTIRQVYELRAGLEALTAELAAVRASECDLRMISEQAERSSIMAEAGDLLGFRKHDRAFHNLVAQSAGNAMAAEQVINVRDLSQTLRQRDVMTDQVSQICGQMHIDIADAINEGNPDLAGTLMSKHIRYVMENVLTSVTSPNTD